MLTLRFTPRSFFLPSSMWSECWPCSSTSSLASEQYPSSARVYPRLHQQPSRGSACATLVLRYPFFLLCTNLLWQIIVGVYAVISKHSQKCPPGTARTGLSGYLVQSPRLLPNLSLPPLRLDTLSAREAFPSGWVFGFGKGLGAG